MRVEIAALAGLALGVAGEVAGQKQRKPRPDSVTVVADSTLRRSDISRWLLGPTYRELWATPIRVEVLDPDQFAGGLEVLERGGGMQTRSLRFQGADGRQYQFRLVRKNAQLEDSAFDGRLVRAVMQDQTSANHPGAGLVVPALLDAANILHARPELRYMPDHQRLEEFREEFANQLGTIEVRPTDGEKGPGFAGAAKIENTPDFLKALRKRPWVRVESRTYLALRLIDFVVGDWDRHEDQYRWALFEDEEPAHWQPIPRDRDQAFARFDGVLGTSARMLAPKLLVYDEKHASPEAATFNGRHLDRRLLNDIEWNVWDSVTRGVQAALTDQVIDAAVDRLPPAYQDRNGATLRRILRIRRDNLPAVSRRFYEFLTRQVLIQAGKENDWAEVLRHLDGRTRITIGRAGEEQPYYLRTFAPGESNEIRIFLHDGNDRAVVRGSGPGPIVRLIGGEGTDTLLDHSTGKVRFYDADTETVADGHRVDRRPYEAPADTNPELLPPQDWGKRRWIQPRVQHSSVSGLSLGLGITRVGYGFRRDPYASLHSASLDYGPERGSLRAQGSLRWRSVNRQRYYGVTAMASGLEGGRFYGFGNDLPDTLGAERSRLLWDVFELGPYLGFGLETNRRLWLMVQVRHTHTETGFPTGAGPLPARGTTDAGHLGPAVRFELDTRNTRFAPSSGIYLQLQGNYAPVTWSYGGGAFGSVEGTLATYLSPRMGGRLMLALQAGGRQVWGDFPYFEAAYLGGNRTLRGYHRDRYAGDRSVFGNSEVRWKVAENRLIIPLELGVLGLADVGRVWVNGESPGSWHGNLGGGLWMTALRRAQGFAFGVARGSEGVRMWFTVGAPLYRPVKLESVPTSR
jgi:hypothetical protein